MYYGIFDYVNIYMYLCFNLGGNYKYLGKYCICIYLEKQIGKQIVEQVDNRQMVNR